MNLKTLYDQLMRRMAQHRKLLESHIKEFVDGLDTQGGIVVGGTEEIPRLHTHMDKFFADHTTPFLAFLAERIRRALKHVQESFDGDYEDVKHIERALGIEGKRIVKFRDGAMTVLYGIGALKVLENDLVLMLNNSLNGEVKRKDLQQNMLRIVSRKYHDFFHTYAALALTQSYNTAQLVYAKKRGYKKFIYVGGLVEDSRDFCVERAGHEFSYEQGKEWDDMWWKGKIEGVPFFIQAGGWNCGHYIEWIKDE